MKLNQKLLCASVLALITFTLNAGFLFVFRTSVGAFLIFLPVMSVSFAIEALLFWLIQPRTSLAQACGMSLLGNFAGSFAVFLSMSLGVLRGYGFDESLPIFYLVNVIAQLLVINVVFKYSFRQLFIPVVLGHALADIIYFQYIA